jgi:hypothetical protein
MFEHKSYTSIHLCVVLFLFELKTGRMSQIPLTDLAPQSAQRKLGAFCTIIECALLQCILIYTMIYYI